MIYWGTRAVRCGFFDWFLFFFWATHIEFDVFQCTVNDLVQSLTVDSNTVSKHMSRTSVRHDVILAHDAPRMVADDGRRRPVAADGGENRQPGSAGKPNRLSNSAIGRAAIPSVSGRADTSVDVKLIWRSK